MSARSTLARLALAAMLPLAGCATVDKLLGLEPAIPLREVRLAALDGANLDSATALDLVFVHEQTAVGVLPRTGPEWFANRAALRAGLGPSLEVVQLDLVPSSALASVVLPPHHRRAYAVYSYANYLAPGGQAVGNLTRYGCVLITLAPAEVRYGNCP